MRSAFLACCPLGPWTTAELGDVLAAEARVSIKPAYCFSGEVEESNDFFRVGYGEEAFPAALRALKRFVEARQGGWRAEQARRRTETETEQMERMAQDQVGGHNSHRSKL